MTRLRVPLVPAPEKCAVVPRRAHTYGSSTFVSFNSRLESNKEEETGSAGGGGCTLRPAPFRVSGFGFRISDFGCWFRVSDFGLQISGAGFGGFGFQVSGFGLGFRVSGFEFQVSVLGFQFSGFGLWVLGFGFRVSRLGSRVSGVRCGLIRPRARP